MKSAASALLILSIVLFYKSIGPVDCSNDGFPADPKLGIRVSAAAVSPTAIRALWTRRYVSQQISMLYTALCTDNGKTLTRSAAAVNE